jgi:hypothetical protein
MVIPPSDDGLRFEFQIGLIIAEKKEKSTCKNEKQKKY